jgi:plasmid stability protein
MSQTVHLPPDLHTALKVRAAHEGVSLQALVERLLRAALRRRSPRRGKEAL